MNLQSDCKSPQCMTKDDPNIEIVQIPKSHKWLANRKFWNLVTLGVNCYPKSSQFEIKPQNLSNNKVTCPPAHLSAMVNVLEELSPPLFPKERPSNMLQKGIITRASSHSYH